MYHCISNAYHVINVEIIKVCADQILPCGQVTGNKELTTGGLNTIHYIWLFVFIFYLWQDDMFNNSYLTYVYIMKYDIIIRNFCIMQFY